MLKGTSPCSCGTGKKIISLSGLFSFPFETWPHEGALNGTQYVHKVIALNHRDLHASTSHVVKVCDTTDGLCGAS